MEDEIAGAVEDCLGMGATFAEVRSEELVETSIQIEDERVKAVKQGVDHGFSVRVVVNGAWGFASTSSLKELRDACKGAVKMARAASRAVKSKVELSLIHI